MPYRQTGEFSKLVLDYIDQDPALVSFFSFPPTLQGIQKAIEKRGKTPANRKVLVEQLKKQYGSVNAAELVKKNIEALLSENTFTITTAHQNNLLTGPLYFIYKIIHTIRVAEQLNAAFPKEHFVPVFYLGTEDADLEELNHIWLNEEKLEWKTDQRGAVGRMTIDKQLSILIDRISGQLSVQTYGPEIIQLLRNCYKEGSNIQQATFEFVNSLFSEYGLIIIMPDNSELKKLFSAIIEDELVNQVSGKIVGTTLNKLEELGYKAQAHPREINLFYITDGMRERIVQEKDEFSVRNSDIKFTRKELIKELRDHPERFSPNVILRGLYQEMILPNIAFIGGGGELSYWLQFKDLFEHYKISFPVLLLRNSFLVIGKRLQEMITKLGFTGEDFFQSEQDLMTKFVLKSNGKNIQLNGGLSETEKLYGDLKKQATSVDSSLEKYVDALKVRTLNRLKELEKKMLRAEKRKFTDQQKQIHTIKSKLFPGGELQERQENLLYYYAKWGREFIQQVYQHSLSLEQEFTIIQEK
jgi:bacillithiol biosynthesis cysteine-adding enzyme BshC